MDRPTMPGVNTRAVGIFDSVNPTLYIAVYDDGTTGPERATRERAEIDYRDANATSGEVRAAVESYGSDSSVFRAWGDIHKDFKSSMGGKRLCLALDGRSGATSLTIWLGPKLLEG